MPVSGDDVPHHFRCPISLDVMSDPVTVSTGHTFDRSSIESWLSTGNSTCPVTRSSLSPAALIPNLTLRRLIHRWRLSHPSSAGPAPTPKDSAAAPSLLRSLLSRSSPSSGLPVVARVTALTRLSRLVNDSDENRSLLSSIPETRPVLTSILFSSESDSAELRDESLSLLAMFRLAESDCDSVSSDVDRIAILIRLMTMTEPNSVDVRANAAAVIEAVLCGTRSPELRSRIGGADGMFEGVVAVMGEGSVSRRAVKVGLKALFALCLEKQSRRRAVEAGAMESLVDLLASPADLERGDAERALATVELLCRVPEGCTAFSDNPLAVPMLVRTILKVSGRATEHAAGTLLAVCNASEGARKEAVEAGVLSRLLLVVQSGCTERGKRKAQSLLKLLRDSWPEDSVGNSDVDFWCSDGVPYSIRK